MSFDALGRILILSGAFLALLGVVLVLVGRVPWLGRLAGDLVIRRDGLTIVFPIVTMIVVSVVGTILLNLILRFFQR